MGAYLYANGAWQELDPEQDLSETPSEPWMYVHIFDSDITTIRYAPSTPATGEAFLGSTPRHYFDDPSESAPTDPDREASGLAAWTVAIGGPPTDAALIRPYLAADDDDEPDFDDDTDDAEIFVELKTWRFLTTLGLPLPETRR